MKRMQNIGVLALVLMLVAGSTLAQQGRGFGAGGRFGQDKPEQGAKRAGPSRGGFILRVLQNPELAAELGITKEQADAIRNGIGELKRESVKLQAELELAAMDQVDLLAADPVDENALMAAVEKVGGLKTEMAKLRIKEMLLIKKHISKEQLQEIRAKLMEHRKQFSDRDGEGEGSGPGRGRGRPQGPPRRRFDEDMPPGE